MITLLVSCTFVAMNFKWFQFIKLKCLSKLVSQTLSKILIKSVFESMAFDATGSFGFYNQYKRFTGVSHTDA